MSEISNLFHIMPFDASYESNAVKNVYVGQNSSFHNVHPLGQSARAYNEFESTPCYVTDSSRGMPYGCTETPGRGSDSIIDSLFRSSDSFYTSSLPADSRCSELYSSGHKVDLAAPDEACLVQEEGTSPWAPGHRNDHADEKQNPERPTTTLAPDPVRSEDRPHTCQHCGRSYKARQTLKNHIETHSGQRNFTCGICGARFRWKSSLNRHVHTHSAERPHVCDRCGKLFKTKVTLSRHHRIHSGDALGKLPSRPGDHLAEQRASRSAVETRVCESQQREMSSERTFHCQEDTGKDDWSVEFLDLAHLTRDTNAVFPGTETTFLTGTGGVPYQAPPTKYHDGPRAFEAGTGVVPTLPGYYCEAATVASDSCEESPVCGSWYAPFLFPAQLGGVNWTTADPAMSSVVSEDYLLTSL